VKTVQRPQKTSKDGYMQRDKLETEEYAKACSTVIKEVGSQDGIDLIDKVFVILNGITCIPSYITFLLDLELEHLF
jgi:hypothetical protein